MKSEFWEKMLYGPRRILVTGHFGSGKTEFSVSLAFALAERMSVVGNRVNDTTGAIVSGASGTGAAVDDAVYGRPLRESRLALADLDIENPYFRSRERQDELNAAGVRVYSDPFNGRNGSELQVISASVLAPVQDPECRIIIDTGGDKSGAMVLNQFSRHFGDDYQLLSVVNCNRPGTDTPEKAAVQIREAQAVTGLKVTGLVSNAHFIRYTSAEDVLHGLDFTMKVSELTGIPVLCACAMDYVCSEVRKAVSDGKAELKGAELFRIGMYMRESYLDKRV
ncbi:MAG: hypothetical protein Q4D40_04820 [Eubacteriales bacterium]|nr:hypothetical protein [Eubacteriales bacterium]